MDLAEAGVSRYNSPEVTFSLFCCGWAAAILATFAAALRLVSNGLVRSFPTVFVYLVVHSLRGAVLLAYFRFHPQIYALFYSQTAPWELLIESFAVVGVFYALTEFYPKFAKPGTVILISLAILGTAAAWCTHYFARPTVWSPIWNAAVVLERSTWIAMIVVLAGAWVILPRIEGIPVRHSAQRAAGILAAQCATTVACALFASLPQASLWSYFLPVAVDLACSLAWLTLLRPDREKFSVLAPLSPAEKAEMLALKNLLSSSSVRGYIRFAIAAARRANLKPTEGAEDPKQ